MEPGDSTDCSDVWAAVGEIAFGELEKTSRYELGSLLYTKEWC